MFRFIEREEAPVRTACRVLGVSESGFHAWRTRPKCERALGDEVLGSIIAGIHQESRHTYGAPRVHAELRRTLRHQRALLGLLRFQSPQASPEGSPFVNGVSGQWS